MLDPTTKTALILEMNDRINERDVLIQKSKDLVKRVFEDSEMSFRQFADSKEARAFQVMICTDLLLERALQIGMSIEFMESVVDNLGSYYVGWCARRAAEEAAAAMQAAEIPRDAKSVDEAIAASEAEDWPEDIH